MSRIFNKAEGPAHRNHILFFDQLGKTGGIWTMPPGVVPSAGATFHWQPSGFPTAIIMAKESRDLMKDKHKQKDQGETILLEIEPHDIDFFNKLLEGYDNLALVTTIDAKLGQMALRASQQTKKDLLAILHCLPIPVRFLTEI